MARFLLVFCITLFALFALELLNPVQANVVQPFTSLLATTATAMILPFDAAVLAEGRVLRDSLSGFAVSIEAGCNGVEAMIVLIAAVLAFPATWRQRAGAVLAGFVFIQALNLVRIISLFYLGQWNLTVFEWTHLYFWPVLIMLDVLVFFALYLRWLARQRERSTLAP